MSVVKTIALPDGGHLNAQIDGPAGAPWLVFSNSVMTDLTIWDAQAAVLSGTYQVLRYDQRGHGESSLPATAMRFTDYGADVLALLDACEVDSCIFVGLSMGVPTGLAALQTAPDRFAGFVAVDGVTKSAAGREAFWTERRETARAKGMAHIASETWGRWLPEEVEGANCTQALTQMISTTPVEGFATATKALQSYDHSAALEKLTGPFLAITGELDGAMPSAMRAQFAPLPQAEFALIAGAGHVPNLQKPNSFNTTLRRFLDAQFDQKTKEPS